MATFGVAWALLYGATWIAALRKRASVWLFPLCGFMLLVTFHNVPPAMRLLASSLLLLYMFKASALKTSGAIFRPLPLVIYMTVWPGMDAESFTKRVAAPQDAGPRFVRGLVSVYLGLISFLATILAPLPHEIRLWAALFAILITVHFGVSNLLTASLQMAGFNVKPLFERPLAAKSINEFWTRRWNLAFVEMNRRLFMPGLVRKVGIKRAVVIAFLISGMLHELAISYPAGGGWGGPMAYFALQALLVALERRASRRPLGPVWTWVGILAPLPLLFHTPFREAFLSPLISQAQEFASRYSGLDILGVSLWAAGGLHLLILVASFQVPSRLQWREELPRLSSFNRKLMWTYGLFIVLCIVSFAVLTFTFHNRFLSGDALAVGLAGFIAIFWLMRVIVDCFYFKHSDWPEGPQFVAGHALLTSLFSFLVLVYGSVGLRILH